MQPVWRMAAELFAASFLEICPEVIFSDIWVGRKGFYLECTLPVNDELFRRIEERMKEKIRAGISPRVFTMSTKNVIEYLKTIKQYKLARAIDRSEPEVEIIKIGEYLGVLKGPIDTDLTKIGAIHLERRNDGVYGITFPTKEELKEFRKQKPQSHNDLFVLSDEEIYWTPEGTKFRKKIEEKITNYLQEKKFEEVEFSGDIGWYGEKKVFTILEEEVDSRLECGPADHPLQKIFFCANSSLQMFEDFSRIMPFLFEKEEDRFTVDGWIILSQEGSGVKIWIDRLSGILVEKRDFIL